MNADFGPDPETARRLTQRGLSKLRTRERVLEAARRLFVERGYDEATVRDIAQAAQVSTGAVFASFADKSELFEAIAAADDRSLIAPMRAAAAEAQAQGLDAALLAALDVAYRFHMTQLPLTKTRLAFMWARTQASEHKARATAAGLLGIVDEVLQAGLDRGQLAAGADVRLLAEIIRSVFFSNYRLAIFDGWALEALNAKLAAQLKIILAGARS